VSVLVNLFAMQQGSYVLCVCPGKPFAGVNKVECAAEFNFTCFFNTLIRYFFGMRWDVQVKF
jgi:hypothetical protein